MVVRLNDQNSWSSAGLAELRALSLQAIQELPKEEIGLWAAENKVAQQRCEANRIDFLLREFQSQLRTAGEALQYEHAFKPSWWPEHRDLYNSRWWINGQTAGVYFIFNANNELEYVGTSCGGHIGARIHLDRHKEYANSIDVVLFERHWPHFALAFEALAIARLKPRRNVDDRGFMAMWINPLPPYDQMWSNSKPK
jgi:hypothetical protein